MHKNRSPVLALATAFAFAGCADDDEVLVRGSDATPVPMWTQQLQRPVRTILWSNPAVANDGVLTVVAWLERPNRDAFDATLMRALLDSETGEVVAEPAPLDDDMWGALDDVQAVVTPDGFQILVGGIDGSALFDVDRAGTAERRTGLPDVDGSAPFGIVVTNDGTTLADNAIQFTRVRGQSVDGVALDIGGSVRADHAACTGSIETADGRLLSWCHAFDGRPGFTVLSDLDGGNATARDVDIDGFARLVRLAGRPFAVVQGAGPLRVVELGEDGALVGAPVDIASPPEGTHMVGDDICDFECDSLSVVAVGDTLVARYRTLGYDSFDGSVAHLVRWSVGETTGHVSSPLDTALVAVAPAERGYIESYADSFFTPWDIANLTSIRIARRAIAVAAE